MTDPTAFDRQEPDETPESAGIEISEFGGIRVAYEPDVDGAWISGWVDVPR